MDMVLYVVSKFAINVSMFHLGFHMRRTYVYATAHAGHPASPTNWPAKGTVDVGRETWQPMCTTSHDRLSSETS